MNNNNNNNKSSIMTKQEATTTTNNNENDHFDAYAQNGVVGPWSAFSAKLLGDMALTSENCTNNNQKKRKKDGTTREKPKRPLSAYNIFFKEERNRILENIPDEEAKLPSTSTRKRKKRPHGKIGFESLAKAIGQRWQSLSETELAIYKEKAQQDMKRYKAEMEAFASNELSKQLEGGESDVLEPAALIYGEAITPATALEPITASWIESTMFQL